MAQFSLQMPKRDTFNEFRAKFAGMIVFNVRGACLFIKSGNSANVTSKIFTNGDVASIESFKIKDRSNTLCEFRNLKVKLLSEKNHGAACGVAVKFLQLSEKQVAELNSVLVELPPAGNDRAILSALDKVAEIKKKAS